MSAAPESANKIALTLLSFAANTLYNGELAGKAVSVSGSGGGGGKECGGNGGLIGHAVYARNSVNRR